MDTSRTILHLDLDAFFCAVEEIKNPSLRGRAFAVGGDPQGRGVVSSCSYAARQYGVHSAMPTAQAVKLCPQLILVRGDHRSYGFYSRKVMGILRELTDQVEKLSIDEAFLDLSPLEGTPADVGARLQARILEELELPNSVGIASNKLVAKIATDVGKLSASGDSPPNALTVVPPGEEAAFLAPLPVDSLWGVGPKTKLQLEQMGVKTIGELASLSPVDLAQALGKHGYHLSKRARGIDRRPIVTSREIKSISHEHTFRRDRDQRSDLIREINHLADKVSARLQTKNLHGRTIQIKLRWSDFSTLTRQTTLEHTIQESAVIAKHSRKLFDQTWEPGRKVRLIGVGVSNLESVDRQLQLWDPRVKKDLKLQETLRNLKEKYGEGSIQQGFK